MRQEAPNTFCSQKGGSAGHITSHKLTITTAPVEPMERVKRRELTIVWNAYMQYNIIIHFASGEIGKLGRRRVPNGDSWGTIPRTFDRVAFDITYYK